MRQVFAGFWIPFNLDTVVDFFQMYTIREFDILRISFNLDTVFEFFQCKQYKNNQERKTGFHEWIQKEDSM